MIHIRNKRKFYNNEVEMLYVPFFTIFYVHFVFYFKSLLTIKANYNF